jgi:hypothetical protein
VLVDIDIKELCKEKENILLQIDMIQFDLKAELLAEELK